MVVDPVSIQITCLLILFIVGSIYYVVDEVVKHLKNVDAEFVEEKFRWDRGQEIEWLKKDENRDKALPLKFEEEYIELVKRLCGKYSFEVNIFSKYKPQEQVKYIGFKYSPHGGLTNPFKAEILRCNKKIAFIAAGDGKFAYLLRTSRLSKYTNKKVDGTIFKLVLKFPYLAKISEMEEFEAVKKITDEKKRESEKLYSKERKEYPPTENHDEKSSNNYRYGQNYNPY